MRILYITNGFPYPLTSGYLRHFHLIRGLSTRHEIHLLSIVGSDFRVEDLEGMRPYAVRIETFRSTGRSRSVIRKAWRRARDLLFASGTDAAGRALARAVEQALPDGRYDVVLLSGKRTDPVIDKVTEIPLVVDLCDATSMRLSGNLPYANPLRRMILRLELRRVRRVESRLIAASGHLLFASRRDRDLLLAADARSAATVVPNGVDLDYWQRERRRLGRDDVVFSGAMAYPPNEDAALFLVQDIMPRVWAAEPGARLRIVGREPTERLRRAASDDRVTVTGFVEDIRPHLERGAVFAAPLRFAAGIQNKLLEAMAMEMPVVTTPVAVEGLQVTDTDRPPVAVANGAEQFSAAIVAALRGARDDPRPRGDARTFVADRFVWNHAVETLDRVLLAAAGETQ